MAAGEKLFRAALVFEVKDKQAIKALKALSKALEKTEASTGKVKKAGSRWGRALEVTQGKAQEFSRGLGSMRSKLGLLLHPFSLLALAMAAVTREVVKAMKEWVPFRDEIKRTQIILKGKFVPSLKVAKQELQFIAIEAAQPLQDVAAALKEDVRLSGDYIQSMKLIGQSAKLATIAQQKLSDVTKGARKITQTYTEYRGREVELVDKLTVLYKESGVEYNAFASSIGRVIPMFKAAGGSLDELLAIMGVATKTTGKTQEAVTGLRAMLYALGLDSKRPIEALGRLGIAAGAEAVRVKGLTRYLRDMGKAIATAPGSLMKSVNDAVTAIEGGNLALQLISKEGMADFEYMLERLQGSMGETNSTMEETMKVWGVFGQEIKTVLSIIRTSFAEAITDEMMPDLDKLRIKLGESKKDFAIWGDALGEIFMDRIAEARTFYEFVAGAGIAVTRMILAWRKLRDPLEQIWPEWVGKAEQRRRKHAVDPVYKIPAPRLILAAAERQVGKEAPEWAKRRAGIVSKGIYPLKPSDLFPSKGLSLFPEEQQTNSIEALVNVVRELREIMAQGRTTTIQIDGETIAEVVEGQKIEAREEQGESLPIGIQSDLATGVYPK